MKGFIFAAGIGSRLKPWTLEHPKALVPVNGIPVLERNIEKIRGLNGIDGIIVNVHHFAGQIVGFLQEKYPQEDIVVSDESNLLLDTGGGLLKGIREFKVNEDVLVHNADILTDIDLNSFVRRHHLDGNDVTLVVMDRKTSRKLIFNENNCLVGWKNTSTGETIPPGFDILDGEELAFGGIHILSPRALAFLKEYSETIGKKVFSIIDFYLWSMDRLKIRGFKSPEKYKWIDVGKPESLDAAQKLF